MRVFIVGHYEEKELWGVAGVFDSEEKAVALCESVDFFVWPVELNKPWNDGGPAVTDAYYPQSGNKVATDGE